MRRLSILVALLPLFLILHCGDKALILTVDLLSFVDPQLIVNPYGPFPSGMPQATTNLITEEINLLDGLDDATEVESAKIIIEAEFVNATGAATARFQAFVNPAGTVDPFAGEPVASIPVTVEPGKITTVNEEIPSSPELLGLLTSAKAQYALRITFNTSGSATDVEGVATLTKLLAVITTKKDF